MFTSFTLMLDGNRVYLFGRLIRFLSKLYHNIKEVVTALDRESMKGRSRPAKYAMARFIC